MDVIKNNRIMKCLLMMVVSLFLVLNFSIWVSASTNYDRQEADACIIISGRFSVKTSYGESSGKLEKTYISSYDIPTDANGYTKSNLSLGQKVHKEYRLGEENGVTKIKEYILPSRKRVDFIDFDNKIIYELKPNNPNQIKLGVKQLNGYLEEVEKEFGKGWSTVLDTY